MPKPGPCPFISKVIVFGYTMFFLASQACWSQSGQDSNWFLPNEKELTAGNPDDQTLPLWVRKLYGPQPNAGEVDSLFQAYYKENPFEKNTHTQYYKRWKRRIGPWLDENGDFRPISREKYLASLEKHLEAKRKAAKASVDKATNAWGAADWNCIGPFDYDHGAAGQSHAPGSSHVYTLEKAPSNPDVLYCGTSDAGIWKTTNRGLNWTDISRTMPFVSCNALEIHPSDPNQVWAGVNSGLYKTTNGGTTWTQIGDAAFKAQSHGIDDLILQPGNPDVLFVASDRGLFRSADGGNNLDRVIDVQGSDAYFSEIEFKPDDANTLYVVQSGVKNQYTELYKSTDAGISWTLMSGWPVLSSVNSTTVQYLERKGAANTYASFTNDNLGTASRPDFTLEMRVRVPNAITDKSLLANKNWSSGANTGWTLAARYTGQLMFNMGNGSSRIELLGPGIWDNTWHTVSVVWRATGVKEMYTDGVLVASSSTSMTPGNTGLPMILGRDGNLNYGGFDMDVDECRIWSGPVSAATIQTWRDQEVNNTHPNYANLLHYYKCNSTSGTTVVDEQGTNSGTITGVSAWKSAQIHTSATSLASADHQKRAEISVTAAKPNRVYALLSGAANGGTGLYGVYVSDDAGLTWAHKCCGSGPGGPAIAAPGGVTTPSTNANMLGYSETGSEEGGQYYYDLAMEADPNNGDKVHIGGINHWYSTDGGTTFRLTAKWSWPTDPKYIHADIHGIHIYGNEVWVNCDGGIYFSPDSGKSTFTKRQFGIAGTSFWGFGQGHKDGNIMLGGTYHNSHFMKNHNVYQNGWVSYTGSADGTRGFVNPANPKIVYNDGGKELLSDSRTVAPTTFTFSKLPNNEPVSRIAWDPRCYNCLYTGKDGDLWYSEDDGANWTLIKNFGTEMVGDIEVAWDDPNVIWVGTSPGLYNNKKLWKTTDRGLNWTDVTPPSATLGFDPRQYYDVTLGTNSQDVWFIARHTYGWFLEIPHKVFYSSNGGTTWNDWTTPTIAGEAVNDIFYQRGTNGGVYVGSRRTVFYRNKSMSDWVQYDNGLPPIIKTTRILPWYKEAKIRLASNRSVWESRFYEAGQPHAQPMVDKLSTICQRDTFYFADYSSHYKTGAAFAWNINPVPSFINSTSVESPKVVFGTPGTYSVSLTVSDSLGSSTRSLLGNIQVTADCRPDTIPDKALSITTNGQYAQASQALNISTNNVTMMAWVKPSQVHTGVAGILFLRPSGQATGLHLDANNELRYHWGSTSYWAFATGLTLPVNEWSHVALVVTPTAARIYLNGRFVTNTAAHAAFNFSQPLRMGMDPNSSSRTFKGLMDEVAVYNRALSTNEIREQMHLNKVPASDPTLLSYYQFNESLSHPQVLDRVQVRHARFFNGAVREGSSVPVGGGSSLSARLSVTAGGTYTFGATGLKMSFPAAGLKPNGDVVVTRINLAPDTRPDVHDAPNAYWVVNNYGSNASFAALTEMEFSNLGMVSMGLNLRLYKRKSGDSGPTWGSEISSSNLFSSAGNGTITCTNPAVTSFSQFAVSGEDVPLSLAKSDVRLLARKMPGDQLVRLDLMLRLKNPLVEITIERSFDGQTFQTLLSHTPQASEARKKEWTFTDEPAGQVVYYRCQVREIDGAFTQSPMVQVRSESMFQWFEFRSNPLAQGAELDLVSQVGNASVRSYDTHGRLLFDVLLKTGSNTIPTAKLKAGVYFLEFRSGQERCLKRLVVE